MNYPYDYTIIGGDMRQVYLVEKLAESQKYVCHYALCNLPNKNHVIPSEFITSVSSLEEACRLSPSIIGPIPLCRNGSHLNQVDFETPLPIHLVLESLHSGQSFFSGCIPQILWDSLKKKGICVYDLMENYSLSYFNSIATAEGAICEAIKQSPINLHGSNCAILGFGKCGYTLCQSLKGLSCHTFVVARREESLAQASILAHQVGTMEEFNLHCQNFDFIFNTIPAQILTATILSKLKPTVTIIDIASSPGGVDFDTAKSLGLKACLCPGLPGIYAPVSSAMALKKIITAIPTI